MVAPWSSAYLCAAGEGKGVPGRGKCSDVGSLDKESLSVPYVLTEKKRELRVLMWFIPNIMVNEVGHFFSSEGRGLTFLLG